ncbi:hypothetical protein SAMN05192534_11028 [Alteribacillus persepolensis]|uniref:Uncharacterized protein n=1 Tax=Alteribacillus persepolensis TaxID=568899 RepID=A0A1G8EQY2_9BACI|nr:hypothetical protein [Alteribacillus persepolensis]SDH72274.1 hypothetical protein SAMN05192534_11028 [Alteribacillus persepolensis]
MLWFLFGGNILLIVALYMYLHERKDKRHHSSSFIMNAVMTPVTVFSLCSGFLFTYIHPGYVIETSIAAGVLGIGCGLLYGSLFSFDSAMVGACNGLMAGIMAPMLGEMAGRSPFLLLFTQLLFFTLLFYFRFGHRFSSP